MAELIAISDYDSDYKLTFEEFYKCFDPMFEPPKESELLHMLFRPIQDPAKYLMVFAKKVNG